MSYVRHSVWVENGCLFMANDDDGYYVERFETVEQVNALIAALGKARDEMWPAVAIEEKGL